MITRQTTATGPCSVVGGFTSYKEVVMYELRELRVQLLLIACVACVMRIGLWAWSYYGVMTWILSDGLRIMLRGLLP